MIASLLILAVATALVAQYAWRQDPRHLASAARFAEKEGLRLALRLPFALFAAACLSELIPDRLISTVMGPDTGLWGIIAASLLGGLLPGGPIVSFPLAVMFAKEGAGGPQVIALVTGWSVYAINRVITYEIPIMGLRFTAVRFIASAFVPVAAALGAGAIAAAFGLSLTLR